jgi:hypothetical protein
MITNKLKVIKDYHKLTREMKEQIKLVFPEGYAEHLINVSTSKGQRITALPFETFDKVYLIRMNSSEAELIIENDMDFDVQGNLKKSVRHKYEEKHSEVGYLSENENYEETPES